MESAVKSSHLPDELWLQIASHAAPRDLWNSLRPVNHQLRACIEQYFEENWLPKILLALPVALPTYDIRNPIRGRAVFSPRMQGAVAIGGRVQYVLLNVEPREHHLHYLWRWKTICARSREANGEFSEGVKWEMRVDHEEWSGTKLRRPRVDGMPLTDGSTPPEEDVNSLTLPYVVVSFEWKPTVTSMFR